MYMYVEGSGILPHRDHTLLSASSVVSLVTRQWSHHRKNANQSRSSTDTQPHTLYTLQCNSISTLWRKVLHVHVCLMFPRPNTPCTKLWVAVWTCVANHGHTHTLLSKSLLEQCLIRYSSDFQTQYPYPPVYPYMIQHHLNHDRYAYQTLLEPSIQNKYYWIS